MWRGLVWVMDLRSYRHLVLMLSVLVPLYRTSVVGRGYKFVIDVQSSNCFETTLNTVLLSIISSIVIVLISIYSTIIFIKKA